MNLICRYVLGFKTNYCERKRLNIESNNCFVLTNEYFVEIKFVENLEKMLCFFIIPYGSYLTTPGI
jgi:hypothetical protein